MTSFALLRPLAFSGLICLACPAPAETLKVFLLLGQSNMEGQLIVGGHSERAGSRAFSGFLDDLALFAGIVPEAEISAIASGVKSPAEFIGPPANSLQLDIGISGSDLIFTWNSKPGMNYNLLSSPDLSTPPETWDLFLGNIAHSLFLPRPAASEIFFVIEEVIAP